MIKAFLISILIPLGKPCHAQNPLRLENRLKLGTLILGVNFLYDFEKNFIHRYDSILLLAVYQTNLRSSFYTEISEVQTRNWLKIEMVTVGFAEPKDNFFSSGANLLLIAGHVAMISNFGWTLPVFVIFYPEASGRICLKYDEGSLKPGSILESVICSNGYFKSKIVWN